MMSYSSRVKLLLRVLARAPRWVLGLIIAASLFSSGTLQRVLATEGGLDPTFGSGGKVVTQFGTVPVELDGMALQEDGKIIAAGGTDSDFAVARYTVSGSLDPTFGVGGFVTTDFFGESDFAFAVVIQRDGKAIAVGTARNGRLGEDFALARYNSDGSLDLNFGKAGKVTTDFGASRSVFPNDEGQAVAIQQDGKIVVVGFAADNNFGVDFALARYNKNGELDDTFGLGGLVITRLVGGFDVARSVVVEHDGRILLAGHSSRGFGPPDFALVRYNSDGSLDTTFGSGGAAVNDFGNAQEDSIHAMAIQADGKIVAVGNTLVTNFESRFVALRYNDDGTLDSTFGSGGKVITRFLLGDFARAFASAVAIQNDGKIVAAGAIGIGFAQSGFAIARYDNNGVLDSTFGGGGTVITTFGDLPASASALAIQRDGRIVAAGNAGSGSLAFALARYEAGNFDLCLQDDSSGSLFRINSATGEYAFSDCKGGMALTGTASAVNRGCLVTLQVASGDRRITASVETCQKRGVVSIQMLSQGKTFTIIDRNTANNSCSCP